MTALVLYNPFASKYLLGEFMLIFFIMVGLIFLTSGGVGLFYINTADHVASGTAIFFLGNLGFGTLALIGVLILIFIGIFNAEFD
jgi:hypothetical protein